MKPVNRVVRTIIIALCLLIPFGIRIWTGHMVRSVTVDIEKNLQKPNWERRGEYIVEHLEAQGQILDKTTGSDPNHVPYDAYINSNWQEDFKAGGYMYYSVDVRVYTDEAENGYMDFEQEVSKNVFDSVNIADNVFVHRDCYYDDKGVRLTVVDTYDVM